MGSPYAPPPAGEYVARVRYGTDMPEPQCPPKMLVIPTGASSCLLQPAFISDVARTDSISVGIDAELGMPLDLIHLSGVFTGDENGGTMLPHETHPPIHPKDRLLLRPLNQLGVRSIKPGQGATASWLRRTEYISAEQSRSTFRGVNATTPKSEKLREKNKAKRAATQKIDADPVRILSAILKGFNTANPETAGEFPDILMLDSNSEAAERAWKYPKHPTRPHLSVAETFPFLPDSSAATDAGGYLVFKFATEPLTVKKKFRDTRIDVGLLKPHTTPVEGSSQPDAAQHHFDLYVPHTANIGSRIKRKLSDLQNCTPYEEGTFRYDFIRPYETKSFKSHKFEVVAETALAIHSGNHQKPRGVYYYPVVGRYVLQPKRTRIFPPGMPLNSEESKREQQRVATEGEAPPDRMNVRVRGLNKVERKRRDDHAKMMGMK